MEMGLERQILEMLDYDLALKRVRNDLQSDFIYAPHLAAVFIAAADELKTRLDSQLRSGTFEPRLPITLEVPKASGFTRPGSILWPLERLSYQLVVDAIAPVAEKTLDRRRVYSHVLLKEDPAGFMFVPSGQCYSDFRSSLLKLCEDVAFSHAVVADVASFFERLYQHVLINLLNSAGGESRLVNFLEKLLLAFTQKDSHGIVQGVFPSDFLGSFYLCSLDAQHEAVGVPSIRYVDDLYAFFSDRREAIRHRVRLSSWLRKDGLVLNEAKSHIRETSSLITEETEVDKLFEAAIKEVEADFDREDFYSSTISWDFLYDSPHEDVKEPEVIELEATKRLFDVTTDSERLRNKIDSFCLGIFTAARDDYALKYVLEHFLEKPHMAQVFAKYLKSALSTHPSLVEELGKYFGSEDLLFDYQRLWLYALMSLGERPSEMVVTTAIRNLKDANLSAVVRAASAAFIGKFGSAAQRRILRTHYEDEASPYVRAAILYTARYFPQAEKNTCFTAWGGHDEVNSLIVAAAKKIGTDRVRKERSGA